MKEAISFQEYFDFNHEAYLLDFMVSLETVATTFGIAPTEMEHNGCPYRGIYQEYISLKNQNSPAVWKQGN